MLICKVNSVYMRIRKMIMGHEKEVDNTSDTERSTYK